MSLTDFTSTTLVRSMHLDQEFSDMTSKLMPCCQFHSLCNK